MQVKRNLRQRVEPALVAENLTVEEAATLLGVGRTMTFRFIREGRLRAFKVGRLTRIARSEATRCAREMAG
jgi:excisionase family DNA binding protein